MKLSLPAALAAALLLGGAGAQTLVPFKDPKLPFTVSLPRGWLGVNFEDKTSGVSVVSAKQPPATLIRLLFMPKNGRPGDVNQEFAGFEAGVKQTGGTLKQLSSKPARYGGVGGIEREYALTHPKGKLRLRIWFGNGAKNLYSFQVTDTPERYPASSALFSKVLATIRF
ncbi:hypothetical protein E5F05_14710 [Deinococcus metallilatus]|uniref:DUF1795 domain-containing protein n=2 Tax=Deinococcus TaxID=1298 RepID=A0AAJ5F0V9_9DEIO|nr:hypothetical protein [Deinococcus metallilatus]MBB5294323.1 hypothetical protein [Deinococcus metallilatus]QBY09095.1 hypothetical protein E5F05_14710 [Deinococcus metallilatus]RXJ10239.1 hypothetical protein ERJ73_13540 [Deinococcus metallilatus]TLK22531.1 hypothetical protein FCS05_17415 [Deinococcus metallilatus]GMA16340.1 hypothetical protein GCM10025871_26710 [Deinococcus metallilatus]